MDIRLHISYQITAVICCLFTKIVHSASILTAEQECETKVADLIFAVDTSSSVWDEDVEIELQFVQSVIEKLPIAKDKFHIGIITFGTGVQTQFGLSDFYKKKEIGTALDKLSYQKGGTNTGGAIKHAREMMFNAPMNRHRGKVDKVMVVITDGHSQNTTNTTIEASISRSHGIKMFAVGIGRHLDGLELRHIANKPDKDEQFVFRVDTFDTLKKIESPLAERACKAIETTDAQSDGANVDNPPDSNVRQYCGGKPADIQFVLDSSSSIDKHNFRKMLNFVTELVDMFDIGPSATRVGVLAYSSHVRPWINLDESLDKTHIKRRIRNLRYIRGGTQTGSALKFVRERGFSSQYPRQSVAHVVILITDGQSADTSLTLDEARRLQDMGVYTFALGIGDQIDSTELEEIASKPTKSFMFEMADFDALSSIKNVLAIKTCMTADDDADMQKDQALTCDPHESKDVMFVYDAHSIGEKKSELLAETIVDLMSTINSRKVHSGMMIHSCDTIKDIPLSSYRKQNDIMSTAETTQSDGLPVILRMLRLQGYRQEKGGRQGAKRVAFVIIDGHVKNPRKMILEAKRLRFGQRAEVYVVAIGDTAYDTVTNMASEPASEHSIVIPDFSSMLHMKTKLLEKICLWHV